MKTSVTTYTKEMLLKGLKDVQTPDMQPLTIGGTTVMVDMNQPQSEQEMYSVLSRIFTSCEHVEPTLSPEERTELRELLKAFLKTCFNPTVCGATMQKRLTAIVKTFQKMKGSDILYAPLDPTQTKLMATCPNPQHPDLHPSCQVDLESGSYYCFGCETSGNINLESEEFKM